MKIPPIWSNGHLRSNLLLHFPKACQRLHGDRKESVIRHILVFVACLPSPSRDRDRRNNTHGSQATAVFAITIRRIIIFRFDFFLSPPPPPPPGADVLAGERKCSESPVNRRNRISYRSQFTPPPNHNLRVQSSVLCVRVCV